MPDTQDKRDIAKDRAMCEALEIDRWVSVQSRTEYGGDDSWIEVTLTHDDTTTIGGNAVYEIGKALSDYLTLCKTQQKRIGELEATLDKATCALSTTDCCPYDSKVTGCPGPFDGNCERCWAAWAWDPKRGFPETEDDPEEEEEEKHRPKIYVAGPYSSSPQANTDNAVDVGELISLLGGDPFIPHLSHYRDVRHWHPYDFYIGEDLRWLAACDALFRIPGESKGADGEIAEAERLGIPVFHDLDALRAWVAAWKPAERDAECAAMREALEMVIADPNLLSCGVCGTGSPRECNAATSECVKRDPWRKIQSALSSDAGKGLLERLHKAKRLLQTIFEECYALDPMGSGRRVLSGPPKRSTVDAIDAFLKEASLHA